MSDPSPYKKLAALEGTWVGEEEIVSSTWEQGGNRGRARTTARLGLGGFFLLTDYTVERDDNSVFEGHAVHGYDSRTGMYTMYWFDSLAPGKVEPALGKWEGDSLIFEQQVGSRKLRYVYSFEGTKSYTFRIEQSANGVHWTSTMEGRHTRA